MKLLFICPATVKNGMLHCPSWTKSIVTFLDATYVFVTRHVTEPTDASVGSKTVRVYPLTQLGDLTGDVDLVVIFGTENSYSWYALQTCEDKNALNKTVMFLQGISRACYEHYTDGVPEKIVNRWLFRDLLRKQNIAAEKQAVKERAEKEERAVMLSRYFIGRTSADRSIVELYHPDARYFKCGDILRDCFYTGQWSADNCERHRIFICQYYYPIKGFHFMLEAAQRLVPRYPDLKIAVSGYNPVQKSLTQKELKDSSYIRYIKSLVKQYGLEQHIELLGELNEEDMKREYLKAHVYVLPSTIENSPNSLAEAMMLGVPSIASDVGGIRDLATSPDEVLLYPSSDTAQLAQYIDNVFSDPSLAAKLSEKGRIRARREYDIKSNIAALQDAFSQIAAQK